MVTTRERVSKTPIFDFLKVKKYTSNSGTNPLANPTPLANQLEKLDLVLQTVGRTSYFEERIFSIHQNGCKTFKSFSVRHHV